VIRRIDAVHRFAGQHGQLHADALCPLSRAEENVVDPLVDQFFDSIGAEG
jgi:hypothetical protein